MKVFSVAILTIALSTGAEQFDLACSGTLTMDSKYLGARQSDYEWHQRIDLTAGKWCRGNCSNLQAFADIQPSRLILEKKSIDLPGGGKVLSEESVDRTTGEHSHITLQYNRDGELTNRDTYVGKCVAQPFSGMEPKERLF